ncbi:DNA modification methylase [Sulfuritortus calidifontis]|uniref:DNA modification methylase n=1 Tax=Sulfuritortus calidifontis TaxID=1914471 RepID=UPI000F81A3FC|nr:DNA modification methylase [Sulfuritortus calidifontis]
MIDYARNPRKNDHAVDRMAAAIVEFGFRIPVVARSTGEVVDGHLRLKAARKLGLKTVPVVLSDELSDVQIKAFRLIANRSVSWAQWDEELLSLELAELSEAGYDLGLTGFSSEEIEELLAGITEDPATEDEAAAGSESSNADEDDVTPPAVAVTRPGDLWLLGKHRLLCADSRDAVAVARLLEGERAHLLFTSPPYANQRDYTTGGIADWDALMQGVFGAARGALREDTQILVNLGLVHRDNEWQPYWDGWIAWMRTQGWRRFGWYVWDQSVTVPGDWAGRLAPRHEFVFHFNRRSRKPNKIVPCKWAGHETHLRADGSSTAMRGKDGTVGAWCHAGLPTQDFRIPDSVIEVTRQRGRIGEGIDHPAVFPLGLPKFFIEAYTDAGEIVFEPFAGSGTTLLAGQLTGRPVRAIELAPEYVDVALRRWLQHHPGMEPVLSTTGQPFAEVAAERLGETAEAAE